MTRPLGSAALLLITFLTMAAGATVNMQVAAERKTVADLQAQLAADARDIRDLHAELRTRARMPLLQRWNDNVLQMSAPTAGQYLRSAVQLAAYADNRAAEPALRYAVTPATPDTTTIAIDAPVVRAAYQAPAPAAGPRVVAAAYAAPVSRSQALADDIAATIAAQTPERAPRDLLPVTE